MTVSRWSAEKRVTVEIRKILNSARRAGTATDFVTLQPTVLPEGLDVRGELVCAGLRNRSGRRLYFTGDALYLERSDRFLRLPYTSIVGCEWIATDADFRAKIAHKREHGDRLILRDGDGTHHELDGLGPVFQGMHNFFRWLLARPASIAEIDRLWHQHQTMGFPEALRGKDLDGIDFVMLDADIAGCVVTVLERGALSLRQVARLGIAYRNCSHVIPVLSQEDAPYFHRLERLANLVLREIALGDGDAA